MTKKIKNIDVTPVERCACGEPLHYQNPVSQRRVESFCRELGPLQTVTVDGLGSWRVPRHFIALHGLVASELPALAKKYGFKRVSRVSRVS